MRVLSLKQRGGNFNGCVEMGSVVCSMPAHSGSPPAGARCSFHSLESHCIRVCHTCTSRVPCVLLLIPAAPHGHYFSSLSHQGSRGSPTPSPRATPRKNKIRWLRQYLSSRGYRQDPGGSQTAVGIGHAPQGAFVMTRLAFLHHSLLRLPLCSLLHRRTPVMVVLVCKYASVCVHTFSYVYICYKYMHKHLSVCAWPQMRALR